MRVTRSVVAAFVLAASLALNDHVVASELDSDTAKVTEEIHRHGSWNIGTLSNTAAQRWNLDAVRLESNELRGRITVSDSPLIDSANVEGRLSGRGVTGKLVDDEGKVLVEFEGSVTAAGAAGTYRDREGGTGRWESEGPLP